MVTKSFNKLPGSLCDLFQSIITTNNNIKLQMRFLSKNNINWNDWLKQQLILEKGFNTLIEQNTSDLKIKTQLN